MSFYGHFDCEFIVIAIWRLKSKYIHCNTFLPSGERISFWTIHPVMLFRNPTWMWPCIFLLRNKLTKFISSCCWRNKLTYFIPSCKFVLTFRYLAIKFYLMTRSDTLRSIFKLLKCHSLSEPSEIPNSYIGEYLHIVNY